MELATDPIERPAVHGEGKRPHGAEHDFAEANACKPQKGKLWHRKRLPGVGTPVGVDDRDVGPIRESGTDRQRQSEVAHDHVRLESSDFDRIVSLLAEDLKHSTSEEDFRATKRLKRITNAITSLRKHGPDPSNILNPALLPEGYHGKILLISVSGGIMQNTVILRSGDLWHSEILRETREEIKDLGLVSSGAYPLGGAWARFDMGGAILIWGTSDQYGACDKETAAQLLKKAYPDKQIRIE